MKNLLFYSIVVLVLCSSQSCHRYVYTPNAHNVPLLEEKGDVQIGLYARNLQSAYAVTDNIGIMLNGYLFRNSNNNNGTLFLEDPSSKRSLLEFGTGYFNKLDNKLIFEVYGGAGIGRLSFDPRQDFVDDEYSAKSTRLFLQPSIGYGHEFFDLAFSLRFSKLDFRDGDTSNYIFDPVRSGNSNVPDHDLELLDRHSYAFMEPTLTVRFGWKFIKMHLQVIPVYQFHGPEVNHRTSFVVGAHLNLAERYRKEMRVEG